MRKNCCLTGTAIAFAIALLGPPRIGMPARAQQPGSPPPIDAAGKIDPVLLDVLATAAPAQPVEAVVTFNQSPSALDYSAVTGTGAEVLRFNVLPMMGVRGTAAQISQLFNLTNVRSIYYNRRLTYFLNESVPLIGADRVSNELGYTGSGVGVAIIDTGIDATHADLPAGQKVIQNVKVVPDVFAGGAIFVEDLPNTDTTSGHGTHVASTIGGTGAALAGKYRGVAAGANLVGLGAGDVMFVLRALESFDWVLTHRAEYGIRVISNSWGDTVAFSPDDPINVASRMAYDSGLVIVFAAGNGGPEANEPGPLNSHCAPWVICVAAGLKDGRTLAGFSSRGVPGDPLRPTITAPGVTIAASRATTGIWLDRLFAFDVISLGSDAVHYVAASGTSMATPHVSGTVALMLQANPALSPDQIKSALEATATVMPGYAQHEVGAGYLDSFQAVTSALIVP